MDQCSSGAAVSGDETLGSLIDDTWDPFIVSVRAIGNVLVAKERVVTFKYMARLQLCGEERTNHRQSILQLTYKYKKSKPGKSKRLKR